MTTSHSITETSLMSVHRVLVHPVTTIETGSPLC